MKTAVISCSAACFLRLSTLNVLHAEAADVTVGGSSGWANGIQYGPLQGQQGDVLVFNYRSGRHNVIEVSSLTCDALNSNSNSNTAKTLAATSDPTPVRVTLDQAGVRYFACSVGDHCDEGQIIQVTTSAGAAAAPATSPAAVPAGAPASPPANQPPGAGTTPVGIASASPAVTSSPPAQGSAAAEAASAGIAQSGSAAYYHNYAHLKHVHAWLLGTVFIFLLPLGIFIARGWKSQTNSIWFHLHWVVQAIAIILAISGVVLGHYFAIPDNIHKAHRIVGIIAVSFLGFQVLVAAALRPSPFKWIRKIWNLQHWWIGRAALILGIVNFYIGVFMYYDGDMVNKGLHLYIAAAAILGTFLLLAILKDAHDYMRKPLSPEGPAKHETGTLPADSQQADQKNMEAGQLDSNRAHIA